MPTNWRSSGWTASWRHHRLCLTSTLCRTTSCLRSLQGLTQSSLCPSSQVCWDAWLCMRPTVCWVSTTQPDSIVLRCCCNLFKKSVKPCFCFRGEPADPDGTSRGSTGDVTLSPTVDEQCGAGWLKTGTAGWGSQQCRGGGGGAGRCDGQQSPVAPRRGLGVSSCNHHGAEQSYVYDRKGKRIQKTNNSHIHLNHG